MASASEEQRELTRSHPSPQRREQKKDSRSLPTPLSFSSEACTW